jgi:hypothetical protein
MSAILSQEEPTHVDLQRARPSVAERISEDARLPHSGRVHCVLSSRQQMSAAFTTKRLCHSGARAIACALLDGCTLGGILSAPVLSIAGGIGLLQLPTTLLHQMAAELVGGGSLLLILSIACAHFSVGLRRAQE